MGNQIFACPACGGPVAGVAAFGQAGLKCPKCGLGFVPPELQARPKPAESSAVKWVALGALLVLTALILVFGSEWLGASLAMVLAPTTLIILLLIGIFVRLGKLTRR
ncbi:MAG: hypothetical protein ACLQM8_28495 [Limisphaerales bacterium]